MSTKILAVDTATENCSVALLMGDEVISRCEYAPREHTTKILPMVDTVLAEAGIKLNQLDALAYGQGPGSFTGVRIGIGIAQGLAFGADLPMVGVSTLAAMAQGTYRVHQADNVLSAIDARMGEIYWGQYQRKIDGDWQIIGAEQVIVPDALVESVQTETGIWLTAGTAWEVYADTLAKLPFEMQQGSVLYPDSQDMVHLAKFAFARGESVSAEVASPVYLRDTVTWKKLPGRE
ncbi:MULTISPECIES: tRNA (adenosine(37)-N6)-threonylcarbamoyltransferase complex dimerization subunit type 1 TsaB [unclassified Photobacterium]|uniref:tRNA (adenosine(37)-N6)-threonylcarbamoyltransferase complex dimerization subunit type 1 TsaB n=1 Tax=unclassified Photobacterium TaxID=2628852 RepID=UPI000D169D5D|nr:MULTISPECIES: tRNA (adenosine(37)-N6)-threonylcarbamoyltransferase complex dimerization subunit type 1 TsaB [unclassified Photobacterium]PSV28877.1 tRNA (adenosine(37)-N6)-threonylcarbamoyltransferase complex dimerization subunit type 1 TsaB [Photobacterium sp. GB-56]PSV33273.1 tRNA (adenosine(37)-N6)-threonylcarbamoyltransferase complex dimerization subunit type 1 TsaB [Photobacterium sp. GB-72]PSV40768.1 tRNA (adenosine(37)-N6)-threonylcarbamoyltransferase complex dimerization subunit type 